MGLIETGAYLRGVGEGGLFNLAKTMVSVLHKELEYEVEKFKYRKLEVMQEDQKQIRTSSWWINHSGLVDHTKFYCRDWLKQSIIY